MANENLIQKFASLYTDKSINGWIRGAMFVGTGIVIYSVGHIAYKAIFKTQAQKDAAAAAAALDTSISNHESNGGEPSYDLPNYTQFADSIYQALGTMTGDSYSLATDTLKKMKTDLDVELLIKAFDIRPAHTKLQSLYTQPMGLFAFVNAYFSDRWFGLWNQDKNDVNSDWASKGITYQNEKRTFNLSRSSFDSRRCWLYDIQKWQKKGNCSIC
jgi:hypothetical protein